MVILLIDNYDSFTFNLYQQISVLAMRYGWEVRVARNDRFRSSEILSEPIRAVVVSPGPGRPEDTGECLELIPKIKGEIPVLGVCLGHQLIAQLEGAKIVGARSILHGKRSRLNQSGGALFERCPSSFNVGRYHSLAIEKLSLPENFKITAESHDGEVMAIEDPKNKLWGVQFHPESFLTEHGDTVIENFLKIAAGHEVLH